MAARGVPRDDEQVRENTETLAEADGTKFICANQISMTHADLCDRAVRWLYGSRRCNVAFAGIASTREIPDAIGWSTCRPWCGSIVIECKMSMDDFRRDKNKKHETRMGNRRYFMCPLNVIGRTAVERDFPDHGLLYVWRERVYVEREATEREDANLAAENRLLQFAIVHIKGNLLREGREVDLNALVQHPLTKHFRDRRREQRNSKAAEEPLVKHERYTVRAEAETD
jgi:hypothetical protein